MIDPEARRPPLRRRPPAATTVSALFRAALRAAPDTTVLAMEQATLTYAQAADWSKALAGGLAARGVKRGDRVAIVSTNRPEMIVLWLACLRLGACFCPINPGFTGGQLANVLRRMTPALIVAEPATVAAVAEGMARAETPLPTVALGPAPPAGAPGATSSGPPAIPAGSMREEGDLAAILCTSGTTGPSKAVALSHRWFTKICETTERYWSFSPRDVFYSPFPLYHIDALAITVAPALYHATTAAIGVRFSVRRFWDEVRRFEATVFDFMGSTLALLWKKAPRPDDRDNPARLGWGVPFPDFAPAFEERFGCTLIDCYGSTDVGLPVCGLPGEPQATRGLRSGGGGLRAGHPVAGRRTPPARITPGRSRCGRTSLTRSWRGTSAIPRRRSGPGGGSGTTRGTAAGWIRRATSTSRAG